ncbi:hypothetical protein F7725_020699 [Dissostichus mawsoni]|uniref:Uncharacterized protein n=1 Tax=Dissostichus mawsoni TaxID=36200 RepID=A0A7J5YF94_DISMA|nr:hypothetical protein F7725_020699 [Dissostichus mawsoni]
MVRRFTGGPEALNIGHMMGNTFTAVNWNEQRCQQSYRGLDVFVGSVPVLLTCQVVVALDLGSLHGSPLILGQLAGGLIQQVDLGARGPVHQMHPFELQQRPVVLADRFPEFLLLVAAVTLCLEVDGFLDLRLHVHFSGSTPVCSGGRGQAPATGFRSLENTDSPDIHLGPHSLCSSCSPPPVLLLTLELARVSPSLALGLVLVTRLSCVSAGHASLEDASILKDGAFSFTVVLVVNIHVCSHFDRPLPVLLFISSAKTTEHTGGLPDKHPLQYNSIQRQLFMFPDRPYLVIACCCVCLRFSPNDREVVVRPTGWSGRRGVAAQSVGDHTIRLSSALTLVCPEEMASVAILHMS